MWLAGAAIGLLVLSDDPRLLRLGLVAALWVALFAAFAGAWSRRRVSEQHDRVAAQQQQAYERALQSEVTERQEFEARVEAEVRREVAAEYDAELHTLRTELNRLRAFLGADSPRDARARGRALAHGAAEDGAAPVSRVVDTRELPVVSERAHVASERAGGRTVIPGRVREHPQVAGSARVDGPPRSGASADAPAGSATSDASDGERRDAPSSDPSSSDPSSSEEAAGGIRTGPVEEPAANSTPSATSAHTTGTSVTELLAAYGDSGKRPGRRRRRS